MNTAWEIIVSLFFAVLVILSWPVAAYLCMKKVMGLPRKAALVYAATRGIFFLVLWLIISDGVVMEINRRGEWVGWVFTSIWICLPFFLLGVSIVVMRLIKRHPSADRIF
jgi:hypothetical protein